MRLKRVVHVTVKLVQAHVKVVHTGAVLEQTVLHVGHTVLKYVVTMKDAVLLHVIPVHMGVLPGQTVLYVVKILRIRVTAVLAIAILIT